MQDHGIRRSIVCINLYPSAAIAKPGVTFDKPSNIDISGEHDPLGGEESSVVLVVTSPIGTRKVLNLHEHGKLRGSIDKAGAKKDSRRRRRCNIAKYLAEQLGLLRTPRHPSPKQDLRTENPHQKRPLELIGHPRSFCRIRETTPREELSYINLLDADG